jgi:hypothetical protein
MNKKSVKLEVKELNDQGEFVGYASMYDNTDLQGDIVEKGAFTRTLQHKGGQVVMLWQHKTDEPIGIMELEDGDKGLVAKGKLNMEVSRAKEAYALLKQGALKGMSIGYDVVKQAWEGTTRKLKEVKLWEVSLVTFPANPLATVVGVKDMEGKDFNSELTSTEIERDLMERRWTMEDAIRKIIYNMMDDSTMQPDERLLNLSISIDQYKTAMLEWFKEYFAAGVNEVTQGRNIAMGKSAKAGRILSSSNLKLIEEAMTALQALLSAASPKDSSEGSSDGGKSAKELGKNKVDDIEMKELFSFIKELKK